MAQNAQVWRLRMKAFGEDFADRCWQAGELGIWYGGWPAELLNADATLADLNGLPAQHELEWDVTKSCYKTALRFRNIPPTDWVLVYLKRLRSIGLAQIAYPLLSRDDHELNKDGEIFKYRVIVDKKIFKIDELPDAYQLLAAQGQANVHNLVAMKRHVDALVEYQTSHEINDYLRGLTVTELLDFLGASAWESFCMAYLITEEGFVPTGLSAGRTLAVLDLVGRSRVDGKRVYAQCKKMNMGVEIGEEFLRP
jgi:hypothetical protein